MEDTIDYFGRGSGDRPDTEETVNDPVNHPSHYTQGEVECIEAIKAATLNKVGMDAVCTANVIKYIWRCESKGGIEDLKKALWYLIHMIELNEKKQLGS